MTVDSIDLTLIARRRFDDLAAQMEQHGCIKVTGFHLGTETSNSEPVFLPIPGYLLNDGNAKDKIFAALREMLKERPEVIWMSFGSEAFLFDLTESGKKLITDDRRFHALVDRGFKKLESLGYGKTVESLQISAQSRDEIVTVARVFKRDDKAKKIVWFGEVMLTTVPQANYRGRTKMWGDLRPENLE